MPWTRFDPPLPLAGWNGIDSGDSSISLARSRSRHRLYVMVKSEPHVIAELDETTLAPLRSIKPAPDAFDIEITPDEAHLYMASFLTGHILRYNTDTLALEATLDAPVQCRRIALLPRRRLLFAASYPTGELVVYDTRTDERRDSFFVAPRLEGMSRRRRRTVHAQRRRSLSHSLDILRDRALGLTRLRYRGAASELEMEGSGKGSG